MRVLVTGGAGYVGSISVEALLAAGHEVTVLDSLVTGHVAAVSADAELVVGSVADTSALVALLLVREVEAVLHCAARSLVGESVRDPALYYHENVVGGVALLDAMREAGVGRLVFSSSAAVYGHPATAPVAEDAPLRPISPYGATKVAFEEALRWYGDAYGLRAISLRYFNAAGASLRNGEDHTPETHLIPNLLRAVLSGKPMTVLGNDYPTRDGTPVRDYIHVEDLADAHLAALERTAGEAMAPGLEICNLGSGAGSTVREVLAACEAAVGRPVPHVIGPRRAGDPAVLVASNERARELLGWTPRRGALEDIIGSAWAWREGHRDGYEDRPAAVPSASH
ncbi:MAG: UDP-glucose 4-epimerase GalE [Candidatus Limnocylindrales bacterium]